ncbi:hemolysin XhlA family protein [Lysinibacillus sp. NPDC093712]|uniref:hemolysin XhlA family protein n=1 Tax=Lysinibacillus sp. NPDC093712 TaxID=3390579 RepID=UPI003D06007D
MEDSLVRDIYQRLGGIEAKLDDVRAIRQTANIADATANQALRLAESHEEELKEMRAEASANRRWLIGTIIGGIFSTIGVVTTILALN